jgi:hypothetical protein
VTLSFFPTLLKERMRGSLEMLKGPSEHKDMATLPREGEEEDRAMHSETERK